MRAAAFAMLIAGASAVAAPETRVFVDGHPIDASVIESNGAIYLPADAVARALGVEFTIKTNEPVSAPTQTVETPAVVTEPVSAPPSRTVELRTPANAQVAVSGKLTWHKDVFNSNAPDRGAQAWLVTQTDIAGLAAAAGGNNAEPIPTSTAGWAQRLNTDYKFARTVADGDGRFSFEDVPAGSYLLVLKSRHANGLAARDRDGKVRFKAVEVRDGQTTDVSFNFGVAAYRDDMK